MKLDNRPPRLSYDNKHNRFYIIYEGIKRYVSIRPKDKNKSKEELQKKIIVTMSNLKYPSDIKRRKAVDRINLFNLPNYTDKEIAELSIGDIIEWKKLFLDSMQYFIPSIESEQNYKLDKQVTKLRDNKLNPISDKQQKIIDRLNKQITKSLGLKRNKPIEQLHEKIDLIKQMKPIDHYYTLPALSNFDIDTIVDIIGGKLAKSYLGTIPRDKIIDLTLNLKQLPLCFIYNTDPTNYKGRHWRAVYINLTSVEFYDSLVEPLQHDIISDVLQLVEQMNPPNLLKIKISNVKTQFDETPTCGYHAINFLYNRCNGVPFKVSTGFSKADEVEEDINQKFKSFV